LPSTSRARRHGMLANVLLEREALRALVAGIA
jgi:hypothetical protein